MQTPLDIQSSDFTSKVVLAASTESDRILCALADSASGFNYDGMPLVAQVLEADDQSRWSTVPLKPTKSKSVSKTNKLV